MRHFSKPVLPIGSADMLSLALFCAHLFSANLFAQNDRAYKALRQGSAKKIIHLQDALAQAQTAGAEIRVAKEKMNQKDAARMRTISLYMPKLKIEGSYTANFPEVKVNLNGSQNQQQAQVYDSVADLLDLTQGLRPNPAAVDQAIAQATSFRQAALNLRRVRSSSILIQPASVFDAKLSFVQPLLNLEAIALISSSSTDAQRERENFSYAKTNAAIGVSRAYVQALKAVGQIQVQENRLRRARSQFGRMQEKHQFGLVKLSGVQQLDVEVINARDQLVKARLEYEDAIANLGLLIGEEESFSVADHLNVKHLDELFSASDLSARALAARDDVRAQRTAIRSAEGSLRASYFSLAPTIDFVGQGIYTSNDSGFVNKHWRGAMMLQATIDLFDGGETFARISEQQARVREEQAKRHDIEQRVLAEIQGKLLEIETKKSVLASADRALRLRRQIYQDAESTFQSGLLEVLDLIDANQQLTDAELILDDARLNLELARLELMYATGETLG